MIRNSPGENSGRHSATYDSLSLSRLPLMRERKGEKALENDRSSDSIFVFRSLFRLSLSLSLSSIGKVASFLTLFPPLFSLSLPLGLTFLSAQHRIFLPPPSTHSIQLEIPDIFTNRIISFLQSLYRGLLVDLTFNLSGYRCFGNLQEIPASYSRFY